MLKNENYSFQNSITEINLKRERKDQYILALDLRISCHSG